MIEGYNYYFDIAALVILVVLSFFFFKKKHISDNKFKIFSALIFCAELTPILDMIGSAMVVRGYKGPWFTLVDTVYYVSYLLTTFFYMEYIFEWLAIRNGSYIGRVIRVGSPLFIASFIVILNPLFKWFEASGELNYHRGMLNGICQIVSVIYLIWGTLYVIRHREVYNKGMRYTVYNIAVVYFVPIIIGPFFKGVQLTSFANAMVILLIMFTVQLYESNIDPVTGMMNKDHLNELCQKHIYNDLIFDIILIRIADYDLLSNSYGVSNTERLMGFVREEIQTFVPIGRGFVISNDLLAIVPMGRDNSEKLEKEIYQCLEKSWKVNDLEMAFSSFVTRITYPTQVKDIDSITACITYFQKMKRKRYGIVPFEELDVKDKIREAQVEKAIETGLSDGNFQIFYQPICTADNQKFVSAEALMRLIDPEMGFISPAEFIPISEKNGSIIQLGYFVIDTVCSFVEKHDMEALGLEYIELNLSTIQCLQRDFIQTIEGIIARHGIDRKYICLEITETASNCAPAIFNENLNRLRELGYRLALDDFGTGYGNLDRMTSSQFDIIKFDRGMTTKTCEDDQIKKIFKYMTLMFHSLNLEIVSEGVETMEQYDFLKESGVDYIQGYYFSKPVPEDKFIEFLQKKQ